MDEFISFYGIRISLNSAIWTVIATFCLVYYQNRYLRILTRPSVSIFYQFSTSKFYKFGELNSDHRWLNFYIQNTGKTEVWIKNFGLKRTNFLKFYQWIKKDVNKHQVIFADPKDVSFDAKGNVVRQPDEIWHRPRVYDVCLKPGESMKFDATGTSLDEFIRVSQINSKLSRLGLGYRLTVECIDGKKYSLKLKEQKEIFRVSKLEYFEYARLFID